MSPFFRSYFLGVLGGMGPLAGAEFVRRLVQLTPAEQDQQHIPTVLRNDPRIPDRSSAYLDKGEDPLPYLVEGVRFLEQSGAQLIAIPCNTAHLWFDQMAAATTLPMLHIVDAVVDDLRALGIARGCIGLMGTPATLRLRLYQEKLEKAGYECIVPSEQEMAQTCVPAIAAVKGNRMDQAYAPAALGIAQLKARGADAVVLGCTELPLAIPHHRRAALDIALTDSIDALARAAIQRYNRDGPDRD